MQSASSALPFEILVDHPRYLVVHKAPGIPFHSEEKETGLLNMLREQESHPEKGNPDNAKRLFAVHRLDRVSSGLLIFARGRKNANLISNLFRRRQIEKIYIALSNNRAKRKSGIIRGGMTPARRGAWRLTYEKKNLAQTSFFSIPIPQRRPGLRLYIIKPLTGRTHQIRVAMKSIGAPILGDGLYGRYDLARQEERAYLHAYALRFLLEGEEISIIDPPRVGQEFTSKPFQQTLSQLGDLPSILNRFKTIQKK